MNSTTQLLAALIAFGACILAFSAVWNTDPARRRADGSIGRRFVNSSGAGLGLAGPKLKQWLASAGFFEANAAIHYTAITVAAAFAGGILGVLAASWVQLGAFGIVAFAAAGAFLLSRFPQLVVDSRWQARRSEVGDAMPLMLDMMHVSTSAGQSVDEAWDSVLEQMQGVSPALAEEMQLVSLEVRLGESRERALTEMAERTGVGDAAALASMLSQSERFGAGLSDTFRSQAESMRQDYVRGMEERAHQSSIKALLPISLLMLPAMLLVSVVPFIIVTLRAFSELQ